MPRFPVKYIGLSSGSDAYYKPSLINAFNSLEYERISNNLPILRKTIAFGGSFFALLTSCDIGSKIVLFGGVNNILFSSSSLIGLFGWDGGSFSTKSEDIGTEWLVGGNDDIIYSSGLKDVHSKNKFSSTDITIQNKPSGYFPRFGKTVWFDNGVKTLSGDGDEILLSTSDLPYTQIDPGLGGVVSGNLLYLPMRLDDNWWSNYNPPHNYVFSLSSRNSFYSSSWVPSIFYARAGNEFYYNGFHYGKFGDWWESTDDGSGLDSIRVVYGGMLEQRDLTSSMPYGYCEILTRMNDEPKFLVNFFFSYSPIDNFGNESEVYLSMTSKKYGGTTIMGFERTANMGLLDFFGDIGDKIPDVHMWSFDSWSEETDLTLDIDAVGVVVSVDNKAIVHRYKGYWKEIFRTENYHSHSVSHDGNIVAIFETNEELQLITKVSAFDMFNPKTKTLCLQTTISQFMDVGEIIPVRNVNNKTVKLPYDLTDIVPIPMDEADPLLWSAPFFEVEFSDRRNAPIITESLNIDGRVATISTTEDECMHGEVLLIRHSDQPNPEGLVTISLDGVEYSGPFNQAAKNLPKVLFSSIYDGAGTPSEICFAHLTGTDSSRLIDHPDVSYSGCYEIIRTLSKDLMLGREASTGEVIVDPYLVLGELSYGGCLDSEGKEDYDCVADERCSGEVPYTATTSCGQYGEYIESNPYSNLEIYGDSSPSVGDIYYVTGGKPPYTVSFAGGEIEDTGAGYKITKIYSCGGPKGNGAVGIISALDSCGTVTDLEVLLDGGQWVVVENNEYSSSNYYNLSWAWVIGSTKIYWVWSGMDLFVPTHPEGCSYYENILRPACVSPIGEILRIPYTGTGIYNCYYCGCIKTTANRNTYWQCSRLDLEVIYEWRCV